MIIDPRQDVKHIGRGDSFKNALTELHTKEVVQPVLVEIGTTRGANGGGPLGDGWATNAWGWYAKKFGGYVHTVDLDPDCIEQCKVVTSDYKESISYHVMTGFDFLRNFNEQIDFLYLDGSDDPQEMVDEYGAAKLKGTALILLDDIAEKYLEAGKGRLVIPMLLEDGWEIVYHDVNPRVMQMLFRRAK
jgi:hypothetical protein